MTVKIKVAKEKDNDKVKELACCAIPDELNRGLYRDDFEDLIAEIDKGEEIEITGFKGCVEVTSEVASTTVPTYFPNSTKQIDEETTAQKTWLEYVCPTRAKQSNDKAKYILPLGYADSKGNRKSELTHEELMLWVDQFGVENIKTLSEMKELMSSEDYTNEESE